MIKIKDFSVYNHDKTLLKQISLEIPQNTFFCLVGESGGGKTLLAKAITGLLPAELTTKGDILGCQNEMELILQDPIGSLQPNWRIEDQFRHLLRSKKIKDQKHQKKIMQTTLTQVGFFSPAQVLPKKAYQLSGGMCQKVSIAFALSTNPKILIADEPTSALDLASQNSVMELLSKIHREMKITILLITHDLNLVKKYGTSVGIMKSGELIEQGQVSTVMKSPQKTYTQKLVKIFE